MASRVAARSTILITGGTKGIGLAAARLALQKGHRIILLARDGARLAHVKQQFVAEGFRGEDVEIEAMDMADSETIVSRVPKLNLLQDGLFGLVNNAACEILKRVMEYTLEDWETTWRVNMLAPMLMIRACHPFLRQAGGSVVNIGSVTDHASIERYSVYGASKAFLGSFTRHSCKELGFEGIRINTVSPGGVDTPLMEEVVNSGFFDPEYIRQAKARIPIEQRWGRPEEVAETIYFALTGPKYLHGADIRIHGGAV